MIGAERVGGLGGGEAGREVLEFAGREISRAGETERGADVLLKEGFEASRPAMSSATRPRTQ